MLNRQDLFGMIKVICQQSLTINRQNLFKPDKSYLSVVFYSFCFYTLYNPPQAVRQTTENNILVHFSMNSIKECIKTFIDVSENTIKYSLKNVNYIIVLFKLYKEASELKSIYHFNFFIIYAQYNRNYRVQTNVLKTFRNLKTYRAKSLKKKLRSYFWWRPSACKFYKKWIYIQVVFRIKDLF